MASERFSRLSLLNLRAPGDKRRPRPPNVGIIIVQGGLAWAPGSIDTILAGGEPTDTVVKQRRTTHNPLAHAATEAPSRASTEELLLELRRRIITPREAREVWEDWGGLNPRGDWPEEG